MNKHKLDITNLVTVTKGLDWIIEFNIEGNQGFVFVSKNSQNKWAMEQITDEFLSTLPFKVKNQEIETELIHLIRLRMITEGYSFNGEFTFLDNISLLLWNV